MKSTLSLILVLVLFSAHSHDLQISLFTIDSSADGFLKLHVRLDKEDILAEMYASCEDYGQVNDCLESYINQHFFLSVAENKPTFRLVDVKHSKEFVEIDLTTSASIKLTKEIEVFNDVLLESKPNQENIVKVSFYDQDRSFRMNKDRIKTTITY